MFLDKIFNQYRQKGQDERWFGSWWMKIHGVLLIGDPRDLGLDIHDEQIKTYYYDKKDRFSQPQEIGQDVVDYRQENLRRSFFQHEERKVISFGTSVFTFLIVLPLVVGAAFLAWEPTGGNMYQATRWALTFPSTKLERCKSGELGTEYMKACDEVIAERAKKELAAEEEKRKEEKAKAEADATSQLKECFKFNEVITQSGYQQTEDDRERVDQCNSLAREFPHIVEKLQ